jgi:hypothetical protein
VRAVEGEMGTDLLPSNQSQPESTGYA